MNKAKRVWLIVGVCLTVVGVLVFAGAMVALGMDFSGLSTVEYVTKTQKIQGDFENIQITAGEADVALAWAEDGVCRVAWKEREEVTYFATMEDRTLTVGFQDDRRWYDYIGIFLEEPAVTVYLPRNAYETCRISTATGDVKIPRNLSFRELEITGATGDVECLGLAEQLHIQGQTGEILIEDCDSYDLQVSTATGDVEVRKSNIGTVSLETSTGDIELTHITVASCYAKSSTGEVSMEDVSATGDLRVETGTGDVELERCDAGDIEVETDTGDVSARLLSGKLFSAKSDTGRIRIPNSQPGGKCQITTDTGDIYITVE